MASGPLVGGVGDGSRDKRRWAESKVYTRKSFNKSRNSGQLLQTSSQTLTGNEEGSSSQLQQKQHIPSQEKQQHDQEGEEQQQQKQVVSRFDAASDDSSSLNPRPVTEATGAGNGHVMRTEDNRVIINFSSLSRKDIRELRCKLGAELDQVRALVKRLDSHEPQLTGYSHSLPSASDAAGNGGGILKRALLEVGSAREAPARLPKHQLSVSVIETSHGIGGDGGEAPAKPPKRQLSVSVIENSHGIGGDGGEAPARPPKRQLSVSVIENSHGIGGDGGEAAARPPKRQLSVSVIENSHGIGGDGSEAPARPPKRQLSVSVIENSHGIGSGGGASDGIEKEKRTPKANQYYRNSEFLLGKDRLPPAESNKKHKTNGSKKFNVRDGDYFGMDMNSSRIFKECGVILSKLTKHKHGWVFNTPVNVKALGLHDYYTIIKHPMDLGTVKSRLNKNWYKSPREFAEDVRLTFHNAMMYNPKEQDVHIMAEQLLGIFEERWVMLEADYRLGDRFNVNSQLSPPAANLVRKVPPPLEMKRTLDRLGSTNSGVDSKLKVASYTPTGRVAAPKKPKAKDPNKRDMTYEEKQKLSANLINLPPEKLDNIVLIIRKRNPTMYNDDDEIEVDIESFDAETLWELDRLVTNYKKSLSKNKKKAELANQERVQAQTNNVQDVNPVPVVMEVVKESKTVEKDDPPSSPVEKKKHGDNASRSSSSSSSSSDSGSSSSDSDSDSSSDSDAPRSPRT